MGKYLDPKNDIPFKRIFGEHPDLLKSFLNALMPFKKDQFIESLEYLPGELVPENPIKKNSIVDVRCKDNYGRQFIVEMQMYWNSAFTDRMLFNASKAYVRQSKAGETYTLLQPVYGLGVINDIFDNITSKCYHHYGIINYDNSDEVIKGLEFVMIELPKFKPSTMIEKKMAVLWLRFLNELKEGECIISEDLLKDEYISQAIALCEEGKFSEAELAAYDYYWDIISTEKSLLATSKTEGLEKGLAKGREEGLEEGMAKGREEGLEEGLAKGREKGLEEGMAKGREEGLEEGLAKGREKGLEEGLAKGREKGLEEGMAKGLEKTVVRSFKNGSSIDFIASITDLSNDEIISILRKHNLDG